jgi:hypothetical protein
MSDNGNTARILFKATANLIELTNNRTEEAARIQFFCVMCFFMVYDAPIDTNGHQYGSNMAVILY